MRKLLFTLLISVLALTAGAQVTTSSIAGVVKNAEGSLPGATVVAVHEPSGTQYQAITNAAGRYVIQGMRPGGPYKITFQFVGHNPEQESDVHLLLGETSTFDEVLTDKAEQIAEVVVISKGKFDASKMGAAQRVTSTDMRNLPSISSSIADMVRMNPQVVTTQSGAMSFIGVSNRYNAFQVDGAASNDVFGLSETGTNGGKSGTQPISMETIEQIQVLVAPFDVRQGGFSGGSINAVTKSGTNTLHGSAYGFWRNQAMVGNYELHDGKQSDDMNNYSEYRAGFTVGGPIVKDKLFFFANYERTKRESQNNFEKGSVGSKIDASLADELLQIMRSKYGYKGSFVDEDDYVESNKFGLKFDYNISLRHKASITWRMVDAQMLKYNSSAAYLNANDYMFDQTNNTNTFTAELQSRFNSSLSNEFQVSYVRVHDVQDPKGEFPCVQIANVGGGAVCFGTEPSSAANYVHQDVLSFSDNVTLYKNNHTFTFGTHNEFYKFGNLFIQNFYGTYTYNSVDDFKNGVIGGYKYQQANESITGSRRWAPEFWASQLAFYAQDKWNINHDLSVTYGLRADMSVAFSTPDENVEFNKYAADHNLDLKTNQKIDASPIWSPRLGFHWNVGGHEWHTIRGGAGLFLGRIPFVWYGNNFSNTGIQFSSYNVSGSALSGLELIPSTSGQTANVENLKASGSQTVNVFAKDFQFVKTLKVNLAYDFRLAGIDFTAEGILSKNLNDIYYQNLAYDVDGSKTVASELGLPFDNRPMMHRITDGTPFSGIYLLDNTSKGYTCSVSFSGKKSFDFGLTLFAGYTYTKGKSVCCANSNVAASAFNYNYVYTNPNRPEIGNSSYVVPNRITASATYAREYGNKHWRSAVSLVYSGYSGSAYSLYYNGDINGDGARANDLMFIPTDSQIDQMKFKATDRYSAEQQAANFKAWLSADDYLSEHRGEYYERYADNEDFEHHFDLHLAQQLKFKNGHAIELSFDVMNVSNMFSKKWGRYSSWAGGYAYYNPVTYSGNGEFQFLHDGDYNMRSFNDEYSRWRGQIGIRYIF